jgi:hypothetical protein
MPVKQATAHAGRLVNVAICVGIRIASARSGDQIRMGHFFLADCTPP